MRRVSGCHSKISSSTASRFSVDGNVLTIDRHTKGVARWRRCGAPQPKLQVNGLQRRLLDQSGFGAPSAATGRLFLSALLVLGAQIVSACAGRIATPSDCATGWHSNINLRDSSGAPAYVESPVILSRRGGYVLLGAPALYWAEPNAFDPPPSVGKLTLSEYVTRSRRNHGLVGFYVDRTGQALPLRPPTTRTMKRISAAAGKYGGIHAVWYTRGDSATSDADRMVWYAELEDGKWSVPKLLFEAEQLDWSGSSATLLLGPSGDVHVLFSFARSGQTWIGYARRLNGNWIVSQSNVAGLPSQVGAQLISRDSILVAYARVGAPGVRTRNGQHIFAIRAATKDTVWLAATRIQWSALDAITQLRVYRHAGSDSISVVWGRVSAETGSLRGVSSVTSPDLGRTWQPERNSNLISGASTLAQAQTTSGEIQVVLAGISLSEGRSSKMFYTLLRGDTWSTPEPFADLNSVGLLSLFSVDRRTVLLVWNEVRAAGGPQGNAPAPVTRFTSFTEACTR